MLSEFQRWCRIHELLRAQKARWAAEFAAHVWSRPTWRERLNCILKKARLTK